LKINVDGSFHSDSHAGSIGAVVRDYKGEFIADSTVFLPHVLSPAVAEDMAMREGLSLANRMGCTNVIMESDSSETVDACNGTEVWWGGICGYFCGLC
jgi:ribonuclease HI